MGCATVPPKNAFLHTFLYYYKKIKKTKNVFIFSVFFVFENFLYRQNKGGTSGTFSKHPINKGEKRNPFSFFKVAQRCYTSQKGDTSKKGDIT